MRLQILAALLLGAAPADAAMKFDLSPASPQRLQAATETSAGVEAGAVGGQFLFSVPVPEGRYRVTVELGGPEAGMTSVKAESRRLMLRNIATRPGETVRKAFLVDVRTPALAPPPANAPGGTAVRLDARDRQEYTWDNRLTLEFLGNPQLRSVSIEPADAPAIFLVGDSTVTDQYAEPAASWGQMLPALLDDSLMVSNHAKSGASLKSFLMDLRYAKALQSMRPGDWLFIQFGHNDQKKEWPQTYAEAATTYPAWISAYIAEARRLGVHPVLVTSPERRNFDADGRIRDTLGDYAKAVRQLAAQQGVPLIDLNADSRAIYEALGPERSPAAFNDDGKDRTHHNNYGAWLMASAVAERIRQQVPELAPHVVMPPFSPQRPPAASEIAIAPSLKHSSQRPPGS